ncbi:MAG TPA: ribonuclease III [Caldisericia bacterium]|nr:ribonuclease III [Caldisericia bacterium]HPF49111.1 ribonuclease III [Caldisericia bacterium]HPI83025.1 ribonuclease III [Caldisericia bacterium]HPQ92252.1 ribonuclease III [Caldisericia bacterium]HRV74650.1 ribonuclease III [Caldisericia bacterium]
MGYRKRDRQIFIEALSHPSYASENRCNSYQRLEFLGDSVVGCYAANRLFKENKDWQEGQLTRARASIVSQSPLANIARELEIGECILLGRGEDASDGRDKDSILCDVFEALIGGLMLSRGIIQTFKVLDRLRLVHTHNYTEDPKSRLQRYAVSNGYELPIYNTERVEMIDGREYFHVSVLLKPTQDSKGLKYKTVGKGYSKKSASFSAAEDALNKLKFNSAGRRE